MGVTDISPMVIKELPVRGKFNVDGGRSGEGVARQHQKKKTFREGAGKELTQKGSGTSEEKVSL